MDVDAEHAAKNDAVTTDAMVAEERARIALALLAAGLGSLAAVPSRARDDGPVAGRASAPPERLIDALSARLLAAHSATTVLEGWCGEFALAADPRIRAVRVEGVDKPATPERRARLSVGAEEPVRYRRVRLVCGALVLSEADNWYVPGRLSPAMNAMLETTQAPFGRVVHPLAPTRRNLTVRVLWTPDRVGPMPDTPVLAVEAVLSTGEGLPFCEVSETYTGAMLLGGAP